MPIEVLRGPSVSPILWHEAWELTAISPASRFVGRSDRAPELEIRQCWPADGPSSTKISTSPCSRGGILRLAWWECCDMVIPGVLALLGEALGVRRTAAEPKADD